MRNKLLSIIACIIVAIVTIVACDKKKDIVNRPGYAEFATPLVSNIKYFIKDDPNSQFKIPIGITSVSNIDRKIIIKDSSRTAVNGVQYTIESTTINIPAGKAADSIILKGIYAAYPVGRIDTIFLKIVGGDVPANAYNTTYSIILQGYCDVIPANLVGDFTNSGDVYSGGASGENPYTVSVTDWTSTGPASATVKIHNLAATSDVGFGPFQPSDPAATGLTATLNWSNPSNFTVTIAKQPFVSALYTYGASTIQGSGSFSSCAQSFKITTTVSVSAGSFSPVTTTLMK